MPIDPTRRRCRRVVFGLLLVLLLVAALETLSFVVGRALFAAPPPVVAASAPDVAAGREQAGLGFRDPALSLHPFLGYVYTPRSEDDPPLGPGLSVSEDGFLDDRPAIRRRGPGRVVIGVVGGSVAGQLGSYHLEHLERALLRYPALAGRELDFVRLGMPGYHQPQQVIQVASILAQGGELDILLNLDGFNELAVPAALNAAVGAHPLFPMNWSMVALDTPDPAVRRAMGAVAYLEEAREELAARFRSSLLARTATGRLVWRLRDERLERSAARFAWELQRLAREADEIPYFVRGPERDHRPLEALLPWCVEVWRRSSLELAAISRAYGIRYHHLLQPNQYVPGSKPLTVDERRDAYDPESPYREVVEAGYPLLVAAGAELREAGVAFHDLSMVFAETTQGVYKDNCCHFDGEGNRILSEAIAAAVASAP